MHETHSLRERFLVFFKIFVPILIYQFANFSAAFVDTTMTGQYDALHLAGVAMATGLWSFFYLLNRHRLCLGSDYRAPSRGRSQGSSSSRFLSISLYGFRSITDPLCPRFSGGTLSSGTLRFGTCGQKGSPWLPTLFEPWNYSPSAL